MTDIFKTHSIAIDLVKKRSFQIGWNAGIEAAAKMADKREGEYSKIASRARESAAHNKLRGKQTVCRELAKQIRALGKKNG